MSRPTLFIALGGTGTKALLKLQKRFELHHGTSAPPHVHYLYIDTHEDALKITDVPDNRRIALQISSDTLTKAADVNSPTSKALEMDTWFDPELRRNLTGANFGLGVQGIRMYGRLALLGADNLNALIHTLNNDIIKLQATGHGSFSVYVVTSGGGGTGSGIFLDIGYLLRHIFGKLNIPVGKCHLEGIAAIAVPSFVANNFANQKYNSAALLTELDHFCSPENTFTARYDDVSLSPSIGKEAPYDYIYLVSPTQGTQVLDTDRTQAIGKLEQKIADFLFVRFMALGTLLEERVPDMAKSWTATPKDSHGYPNRFMTLGVGFRQFPIGLCKQLGSGLVLTQFIKAWIKNAEPHEQFIELKLLAQKPLQEHYDRDISELRKISGLPPQYLQDAQKPRPANEDRIYHELIQTNGQEKLVDALKAGVASNQVNELFDHQGRDQPVRPGSKGYIKGTICRNAERLTRADDPASVHSKLRSYLLDVAFEQERGPRYALKLLRDIQEALAKEHEILSKIPQPTDNQGGDNQESLADRIEEDGLLLMWKTAAVKREKKSGGVSGTYANRKFDNELVQAKIIIYSHLQQNLIMAGENLTATLSNLIRYLQKWTDEITKRNTAQQELTRNLPEGTIYSEEIFAQRWQTLQNAIPTNDLNDLKNNIGKFRDEIPRTDAGEYDFSYLQVLEDHVQQEIEAQANNPNSSILSDSVLRILSDVRNGQIAKECEQMTGDSRPLLNLRLATEGYGNLLSGPLSQFPTTLWYFIAKSNIDPDSYQNFDNNIRQKSEDFRAQMQLSESIANITNISTGGFAAVVFIRGAFPTRIINEYNADARTPLLYPTEGNKFATNFIRTGIRPPIPMERLKDAKTWIILAETLRKKNNDPPNIPAPNITHRSKTHTLQYSSGANEPASFAYPNDLSDAAYNLYTNDTALTYLQKTLRALVEAPNDGWAAQRVAESLQDLAKKAGQQEGYFQTWNMDNLDYASAREWLRRGAYKLKIPMTAQDNKPDWVKLDDNGTYHCTYCKKVVDKDQLNDIEKCLHCGYPNIPLT